MVRTAIEALAAVLGGTNSLHTNALDEVLALPSEKAAEIALRTQQVIMEETGVVNVADPLGGSWYRRGAHRPAGSRGRADLRPDQGDEPGLLDDQRNPAGIEEGWFMAEIAEAAFSYQQKVEKGDKRVVGVNCHPETVGLPVEILRVSHEVERAQVRELAARRRARDQAAVDAALAAMIAAARSGDNTIPAMLDAARAEATLGEICGTLRDEWGGYFEAPAF